MSPIEELSDARRLTRDFRVRLGTRVVTATRGTAGRDEARGPGESYPKEQDYFVLEEAPEAVRKLYGAKPKALRIMLPFEWNAQLNGEDLVFSLYNRAYGYTRGLKCRGTGRSAEFFGTARTNDPTYAKLIEKKTGFAPEPYKSANGDEYFNVRCFGRDCPLFIHKVRVPDPQNPARQIDALAPGHEKHASCTDAAILRCFLLHPTTDPNDRENYCRSLGVMELATGSVNSIIDLQSGFDLVKAFTAGRSAGIPMTIVRKPTITYRPVMQTHYTCAIHFDHREVQRWGMIPLSEVFLSDDQRGLLKELGNRPLGLTVDSVRDLIPARALPAVSNGPASSQAGGSTETTPLPDAPEPKADPSTDPADSPFLVTAQLNELKQLAGGPVDPEKAPDRYLNPWKPEVLDRLRAAIVAMREAMGISEPMTFSELRLGHYEWLKRRLSELPPPDGKIEPPPQSP